MCIRDRDEPERRATFAAVVAIIATIDVPICFMITRLIPSSIHPVVLREGCLLYTSNLDKCEDELKAGYALLNMTY